MQKVLAKYKGMAKKKKNGGFTLVELIIVIAIIAVLVAILAPQYLQYVEKSKIAADDSTADQILSAVKVAVADDTLTLSPGTDTVTWAHAATGSTVTVANTATAADASAIANLLQTSMNTSFTSDVANLTSYIKSSKYSGKSYQVTITVASDHTESVSSNWIP